MFDWLKRKKNEKFLDLTDDYEKEENLRTPKHGHSEENSDKKKSETDISSLTPEERKRKLSKRLVEMTDRLDEMSTQVYHLQQRVDLLEKKTGINRFD